MSSVPHPRNEAIQEHAPGSPERIKIAQALKSMSAETADIPAVVGGRELRSGDLRRVVSPHQHTKVLANVHESHAETTQAAIDSALASASWWRKMSFESRARIFLKAADMLTGPWRARVNAACMLGQSKTIHQSEIDAVCELADFFRFNVHFMSKLQEEQPVSPEGQWNHVELRPLEGFVFAVAPFNFLSIAINIPCAPILCGNVAVWKPSTQSMLGCHTVLQMLKEAGLPDGVLNMVPGDGPAQAAVALEHPDLAAIHFTGSTGTFKKLYRGVAERIDHYRTYPRLVGETGGKDFIFVHPSADLQQVCTAIIRGGFEYQGQKCSAASRVYVPRSVWSELKDRLVSEIATIQVGDVSDFGNFMGAVIDERAYRKITGYIDLAKETATIVAGGQYQSEDGWFIWPTLVEVTDPKHKLMSEEIFGPVVTCFVYDDAAWEETLGLVDTTSPYALTGAVFARDRSVIDLVKMKLRFAAGNFYINDKPTGAVVGQQPFGGGRSSGTNDKSGSPWNLLRWMSPRTIKENFLPPTDYRYRYMG